MKERPIPFTGAMVRAILDGRKTQTRRLVKMTERASAALTSREPPLMEGDRARWFPMDAVNAWNAWCPFGEPGDQLWVRERINRDCEADGSVFSVYAADGAPTKADAWPWQRSFLPPMHCPRGLSRINLSVMSVRVERLQAITEDDAKAEGLCPMFPDSDVVPMFAKLWDSINGTKAPWQSNPWVWVVGFEVQP